MRESSDAGSQADFYNVGDCVECTVPDLLNQCSITPTVHCQGIKKMPEVCYTGSEFLWPTFFCISSPCVSRLPDPSTTYSRFCFFCFFFWLFPLCPWLLFMFGLVFLNTLGLFPGHGFGNSLSGPLHMVDLICHQESLCTDRCVSCSHLISRQSWPWVIS